MVFPSDSNSEYSKWTLNTCAVLYYIYFTKFLWWHHLIEEWNIYQENILKARIQCQSCQRAKNFGGEGSRQGRGHFAYASFPVLKNSNGSVNSEIPKPLCFPYQILHFNFCFRYMHPCITSWCTIKGLRAGKDFDCFGIAVLFSRAFKFHHLPQYTTCIRYWINVWWIHPYWILWNPCHFSMDYVSAVLQLIEYALPCYWLWTYWKWILLIFYRNFPLWLAHICVENDLYGETAYSGEGWVPGIY